MGKNYNRWISLVLFLLSISFFVSPVIALDPKAVTRITIGVIVPPGVYFFDGQDYTIAPTDVGWLTKMRTAGWNYGKAKNSSGVYPPVAIGDGNGYFYTVTSTPGINKPIPGNGKALAVEGWNGTLRSQTDFYLEYGGAGDSVGKVPGDVWFQFWILADSTPQFRNLHTSKFIYPTKENYPATTRAHQDWNSFLSPSSRIPAWYDPKDGTPFFVAFNSADTTAQSYGAYGVCDQGNGQWHFGTVNTTDSIKPGEWYLVRMHFNTSQAAVTAGRHLWEVYVRKYGSPNFVLISRWQNGQNYAPGAGGACRITWTVDSSLGWGHRTFRIPTTMGATDGSGGDQRYYLKDFAMAVGTDSGGNGVNDLPVYPDY